MITINYDGKVISRSKNLAGILRYSAKVPVKRINLTRNSNGTGLIQILWITGAYTATEFADFSVMVDWVANRRNFHGVKVVIRKSR